MSALVALSIYALLLFIYIAVTAGNVKAEVFFPHIRRLILLIVEATERGDHDAATEHIHALQLLNSVRS